jgi:hypothetical protein
MNWKYRVDGQTHILSQSEHDEVRQGIRDKMDIISLREGKLGINPRFIRSFSETDERTDSQHNSQFQLSNGPEQDIMEIRRKASGYLESTHDDFRKRMGWSEKSYKEVIGEK